MRQFGAWLLVGCYCISWFFRAPAPAPAAETAALRPDITVAADGSGDFKTVQEAVASIPRSNRERMIVLIKDGVYKEKVRVDAPFVTLRGQSRAGTRIEFAQLNDDFTAHPDDLGRAVINLRGDDFVLENISVTNTAGVVGPHAFAIYGQGDRTVIVDSDVLSDGADTVSLWLGAKGRYYHARCKFKGSVDFVCPRGWCYVTDCNFFEAKATAAVWHDGHVDPDMKFVLNRCKFDGVAGWNLARHHSDAQFYFLNCQFSQTMVDKPPRRVIYPIGSAPATEADRQRNAQYDRTNLWGERAYFFNCHRDGGDYAWFKDNLATAPHDPQPEQITADWTFAGAWDPEKRTGPTVKKVETTSDGISVTFTENVTAKGKPILILADHRRAQYLSGSGGATLIFKPSDDSKDAQANSIDLSHDAIIASEAGATVRNADLNLSPAHAASKQNTLNQKEASAGVANPPAVDLNDYKLVWSDEFNTDGPPDPKNWTYERGFVRNQEAQFYQPENARCENGMLIIEARREKLKNPNYDANNPRGNRGREYADYTSSSMTTRGLHEWTYGRFEMRGRIDTDPGLWPAWWALGRGRWPAGGEIDMMEYYKDTLLANVAWAGAGGLRGGPAWHTVRTPLADFPADWPKQFHVWRMDWDEKQIKLFADDKLLNETDVTKTINLDGTNPFHAPQYMILNLAIGGTQGGDPSKTEFPRRFAVDYVRVYQKEKPKSE